MMTERVPLKIINGPQLEAELRTVAGAAYDGYSYNKPVAPESYSLHFADGTPRTVIDAALVAYANHNPNILTTAQTLAARREAAKGDLSVADFVAVLNQINAAASLADAKPILKKLLALTYRLALAQGLTDAPDIGV